MASAFGFSNSDSEQRTTDNSVTAQDSEIIQGIKSGGHGVSASDGSSVAITDGGAFGMVEATVKSVVNLLAGWTAQQNQFALSGTTALLDNARVSQQESALTSQENVIGLLKFAAGGAVVLGCAWLIFKK